MGGAVQASGYLPGDQGHHHIRLCQQTAFLDDVESWQVRIEPTIVLHVPLLRDTRTLLPPKYD